MMRRSKFLMFAWMAATMLFVMLVVAMQARPAFSRSGGESQIEEDKALAGAISLADQRVVQLTGGAPPITADLFVGVDDVTVDTYVIDVTNGNAFPAFLGVEVWGSAYDPDNQRILFNDGVDLWQWPVNGAAPTFIGTINDGGGNRSMVGLAYANGTLYGTTNIGGDTAEGVYSIDTTTAAATLVTTYTLGSAAIDLGGIDADPVTGQIYGTNDDSDLRGLVQVDLDGTVTLIAPYPGGETDVDGLAVGSDGRAYLITDDNTPPYFNIYDFNVMTYTGNVASPWTSSEIFAGGAWIDRQPGVALSKTVGTDPGSCATTDSVTFPAGGGGTTVYYCFTIANTGNITLTDHLIVDSHLGPAAFSIDFGPGDSGYLTVGVQLTQTTVNVATYTGSTGGGLLSATAVDSATATRLPPTDVVLTGVGFEQKAALSPLWLTLLLLLLAGTGFGLRSGLHRGR